MNHFTRLVCVLSLLLCARAGARAERLPVKSYTTADGLLRDSAFCVVQDSRGFLWFCTGDGLSRFDGYGFINYTTDDGLPHRVVNGFLETRGGTYWVATNDGLARFNPRGQRGPSDNIRNPLVPIRNQPEPMFVTYEPQDSEASKAIEVLFEDRQGKLWCGTGDGLYWFEERDGRGVFHRVDLPEARPNSPRSVLAIIEDRRGGLWVGSDGQGLSHILADGRIEHYTDKNGLPTIYITSLLRDRNDNLWVGMSAKGGLCQLVPDPAAERAVVSSCYTKRDGLADNWIRSLSQTSDGKLWLSTVGGLTTYDRQAAPDEPPFRVYKGAQGLCDGEAYAAREDRDGNIWVSTSCGVKKISRSGFVRFTQADGLASLGVSGIFASHAGELFVITKEAVERPDGTSGAVHTINRFEKNRFTFATPRLPPDVSSGWGSGQIAVQDKAGAWWLPGDRRAVYRLPKAEGLLQLARVKAQALGIPDQEVFRIYEDSRGDVWISTMYDGHLLRWERSTGTLRDYKQEITSPNITRHASCLAEDKAGTLWIGSAYADDLLQYRDGNFTILKINSEKPIGNINGLYFDHAGRLWLATSLNGVGRVDETNADELKVVWYNRKKGLATDGTRALVEDNFGRVYVGHGRGVDRIDPNTGQIKHYTSADGLPQGAIYFAARDAQGALWFGNYGSGVARLTPEQDKPRQAPNIVLTGLRVAGVAQAVSELGETSLPELSLDSDQTHVSIDFLGLGASLGEELRYQHRLEGAGQDWIETSQRTVDFANLAPGSYRFEVRAVTFDNLVSRAPATVSFTIAAPLWERWWFIALAVAGLGVLAYALYRYRVAQLLALERVRTRIATDLHDDIGANLSLIAGLSEVMRQQGGGVDSQVGEQLGLIASVSRKSVDAMSDIVWAVNPHKDHLSDLIQRMRRFASDTFTARDIRFRFSAPDLQHDIRLGADLRRELFLIFKESVHNIARHAECRTADLTLELDRGALKLMISDDGKGFDSGGTFDGQGLSSMKKRAERIGGALKIISHEGRGTTILLTAPLAGG